MNWEALKRQERASRPPPTRWTPSPARCPPSGARTSSRARPPRPAFEFAGVSGALDKLDEETRELREAVERGTNFSEELGDVLFAAVKAGRFLNVDPEDALNAT